MYRGITQPSPCRFVACRGFSSAVDWKNSVETTIPYYFPLNPAWFIGILTMVYYNPPHNWVVFHPPTNFPTKTQGLALFIVQSDFAGFFCFTTICFFPMGNLGKKNGSRNLERSFPCHRQEPCDGLLVGKRWDPDPGGKGLDPGWPKKNRWLI